MSLPPETSLQLTTTQEVLQPSGPSSLLLTAIPIVNLQEECHQFNEMGNSFTTAHNIIFWHFKNDIHFDGIRKELQPFLSAMHSAFQDISESLFRARAFYLTQWQDDYREDGDQNVTDEDIQELFDPEGQKLIITHALEILKHCEPAIKSIETAITFLPQLTRSLDTLATEYKDRCRISEERSQSWLPSVALDAIYGKYDPPIFRMEKMEEIVEAFKLGSFYLINDKETRLIDFLRRWQVHFRRLYEISQDPDSFSRFGYTTTTDFRRLYQDRLACASYVNRMISDTTAPRYAFKYGNLQDNDLFI